MQEDSHKPNWICPFCSGVCNCTRCLRYDTLNKLMSLFSILGGDLEVIKEESYSEKYIHGAGLEMPLDKAARKNSYYALKPTKGGGKLGKDSKEVKGKLDVYKGHLERYQALKDLRIKLERIRILCSQVARRERMKIRLDAVKNKILEEYVDKAKSLLEAKNGKRGKPDFDFIDLEPFKLKKVKLSAGKAALAPTKGKGRVRSNLTDDLLLIKRKRGRPRKEESELMRHLEELRSPEKGKRGRKKKLDILKEYIKKTPKSIADKKKILDQKKMLVKTKTGRPRGRPRKVDKERELEQARMQESPRKRGRPPKIKPVEVNEDELYEPEVSEEEEEEKQEESDEEDLDRDADEVYGELESDEYDEDDEDKGDEGEEGEEFEEEEVGKRGRGRPPKNPPITRRLLDSDESSGTDEGVDEEEGSGEEFEEEEDEEEDLRPVKKRSPPKPQPKGRMIAAKRGRGRPPKNPQITRRVLDSDESSGTGSEFEEGSGEEFEEEENAKRRRGRPPKNPQITRRVLDSDESSGADEEVDDEEGSEVEEGSGEEFEEEEVGKRGRGRPRKNPPITRRVLDSDESSGTDEGVDEEEGSEEFEEEDDEEGNEENEEFEEDDEDEYEDEDEEEERFKLPRELQGTLTHQNANQFDVFNNTLDARRVTRSLYDKKQKGKKGRKKNKRS